jgi:hypothetical protein
MIYFGPLVYFELYSKIRPAIIENIPYPFQVGDYLPVFTMVEIPFLPMVSRALPGTPFFVFLGLYLYYIKRRGTDIWKRKVIFISIIPILLTIHFFLATQIIIPWIAGFHPARYLALITLYTSLLVGIILSRLAKISCYILLVILTFVGVTHYSFLPPSYELHIGQLPASQDLRLIEELQASVYHNQYRIGGVKDGLFNIVSIARPDYYISRGYYSQGILYLDWHYWFEYTLSRNPKNISDENTLFHLLDWEAIRYLGFTNSEEISSYAMKKFRALGKLGDFTIYEFIYASPISEVLLEGGVLFFGDYEGYDTVLRSIASSSYTKPAPVIVWAEGKCIDDVSSNVLESFSSIILYRYCYRDREKAFNLLKEYVYKGGRLFIETMSSTDESSNMPPPIPVAKTYRGEVSGSWTLEIREHILTANITENMFSPPVYDGGPWGVSYSTQGDLRDYAIPLLISNGKILTAYSRYGSGEVIWSGMNLPYHSLAYQNPNEADFMRRLIMGDVKPITLPTEMIRKSATSIIFKNVPEAKGIIFRERYISNLVFSWKAYDREGGLNVFMMGPGFNYIVLREGWSRGDVEMVLEDGPLRIASIAISLITVIILTLTLIRAHYRSKIRRSKHADLPLA